MEKQLTKDEKIQMIRDLGGKKENILATFLELQKHLPGGYIDQETAGLIGQEMGLTETKVYELLTFYSMAKPEPQAKYRFKMCGSAPCHFTKENFTAATIEKVLGIKEGEQTKDGLFSFEYVPCFGACDIAPAMKLNETVHGHMTEAKLVELVTELKAKA